MKLSALKLSFCGSLLVHGVALSVYSLAGPSRGLSTRLTEDSGVLQFGIIAPSPEVPVVFESAPVAAEPEAAPRPPDPTPALEQFPFASPFESESGDFLVANEPVADAKPETEPASSAPVSTEPASPVACSPETSFSSGDRTATGSEPDYLVIPKVVYPREARRRGQQGVVVLDVSLSPEGLPERVDVARSSGFPLLDETCLSAWKNARFVPKRMGGAAIPSRVEVPIRFRLSD